MLLFALALLLGMRAAAGANALHRRIRTSHGPVHVWTPAGYDPATAGIVIYIHGYFTDVDHAWADHQLEHQFAESGLNALFIACEAPSAPGDPIAWTSAGRLLEAVGNHLDAPLPEGPIIAVGHSGAHRTLSAWVEEADELDTIALLDAMYGEQPEIRDWITASDDRRLIDVGAVTQPWGDALHAELPETLVFQRFPPPSAGHLEGARAARIVYVRTHLGHMPIVTGGLAIPMVLRASRIPCVADVSRATPIHPL